MFDSGFGGLTVARALIDLMPAEDIVYIGDTGRYPYGSKPLDEVLSRHQIDERPCDGEATEARIEHPDRPFHGCRAYGFGPVADRLGQSRTGCST